MVSIAHKKAELKENIKELQKELNELDKKRDKEASDLLQFYRDKALKECVICGSKEKLEKHHIAPYSAVGQTNLQIPLCHDCHTKIHAFYCKKDEELLKEIDSILHQQRKWEAILNDYIRQRKKQSYFHSFLRYAKKQHRLLYVKRWFDNNCKRIEITQKDVVFTHNLPKDLYIPLKKMQKG